jgi:hypothetical protein
MLQRSEQSGDRLPRLLILLSGGCSKRASDGETERAGFLEEGIGLTECRDGVEKSRVIRKHGTVGHDRRLQGLVDPEWVVSPVHPEWRLDYR